MHVASIYIIQDVARSSYNRVKGSETSSVNMHGLLTRELPDIRPYLIERTYSTTGVPPAACTAMYIATEINL